MGPAVHLAIGDSDPIIALGTGDIMGAFGGNAAMMRRGEMFFIPIAISVLSIISWILATTLQPGWHSTIFGPYFVIGAIFSGIGALFIAMTVIRKIFGLEKYIAKLQYRNLGLIFITMNAVWFYFTFAENLGIATGQQTYEMPILAVKLWGAFAPSFWLMVVCMAVAFWILVVPQLIPQKAGERAYVLRPRFAQISTGIAVVLAALLFAPIPAAATASIAPEAAFHGILWLLLILNVIGILLGFSLWLKEHPVTATVIAAAFVVVGMWLERWNIIIPTVTHPMLVPYATYTPSLTEISIAIASMAGFIFMFLVFFKLFPAISIWELVEGKVIEDAEAKVAMPQPEISGD